MFLQVSFYVIVIVNKIVKTVYCYFIFRFISKGIEICLFNYLFNTMSERASRNQGTSQLIYLN